METAVISKLDLSKEDRAYYHASSKPEIRDLDSYYYLSISGQSSPDDEAFLKAIEAIYGVAYGIKFLAKGEDCDFVVPKMECHWFCEGGPENQHNFIITPREEWMWKILIRMPDFIESDHFFKSMDQLSVKKPVLSEIAKGLKFELINEGKCAQIMHTGSWDEEGPTVEKLHQFIFGLGLQIVGYHKEIYISDPRRVAEEKKKTILRYQVK